MPQDASSTCEFLGGPCDGLIRTIMNCYRIVRVRTDHDPPKIVPDFVFTPPDLPHLGTYERDPWNPQLFNWKG